MVAIHLLTTALLLLVAIGFHVIGTFPLCNLVDYDNIKDAKKFNQYVGYRMRLPAVVSGISAFVASQQAPLAIPLIFAPILSILAVVVWVGIGSKAFTIE